MLFVTLAAKYRYIQWQSFEWTKPREITCGCRSDNWSRNWKVVRSDSAWMKNVAFFKQGHGYCLCPAFSPGKDFYHDGPASFTSFFPVFSWKFYHRNIKFCHVSSQISYKFQQVRAFPFFLMTDNIVSLLCLSVIFFSISRI